MHIFKIKNRLAEQSGNKPMISCADPRYLNSNSNTLQKNRNSLLSGNDDDISDSLSSSSEKSRSNINTF